ncbi:uncharacterized protein LOC110717540 [Chenopodium quinoa]|uniref:uncharacterized protein LOC110717540 n=1 Tax=Chenopodium quinoa TaxID=63459 RepID=UPI000B789445|nr:uncharacterized protein LOC110717540 [Chenopodium quinoa]
MLYKQRFEDYRLVLFIVANIATSFLGIRVTNAQKSPSTFNVLDYGAKGDGQQDDTQAFAKAWIDACDAGGDSTTLVVPQGKTFLIKSIAFKGPCQSTSIHIQIQGNIEAPSSIDQWNKCEDNNWLHFESIDNLFVEGQGVIDSRGSIWWTKAPIINELGSCNRPTTMTFFNCNGLQLSGVTSKDCPGNHITMLGSNNSTINNINLIAPQDSHNTDGIDISSTSNLQNLNSFIGTGDDCVAIGSDTLWINITNITCGPGHGISVGSLGRDGAEAKVEQIHVKNCTFRNTSNGARIKTWQGGNGYARQITYEDIILENVQNPIIIDQYYCISYSNCANQSSAVAVSDITFNGFQGTSATDEAITVKCSEAIPCNNIVMETVNIAASDPSKKITSDYRHILFIVAYIATSLLGISVTNAQNSSPTFNVLDYGAKGDGQQDDTQTFAKAWIDVCNAGGDSTTLVVPQGYTFLIKYIAFDGPCKSTTTIHIEGNIVAPSSIGEWDKCENNAWLHFGSIDNLVVEGQGVIDGRGSIWWTNAPIINELGSCKRPMNMMFFNCKGLQLSGVTSKDCPGSHIAMLHSNNSIINNINLIAPQDSHNTDGIDIASTNNLQILNSFIGTGDDCVAIGSDSIGINITNVICGPGHGISVGSLGKDGTEARVEQVHVKNCTFKNTSNGARIKTWQGGSGYARQITYENIILEDVQNPIIIDQYYCNSNSDCANSSSAVAVSDVTFNGFQGTSATDEAITVQCSQAIPCNNILMETIYITASDPSKKSTSICENANVQQNSVEPPLNCN